MKRINFITSLFFIGLFIIGLNFVLIPTAVSASDKAGLSKDIDSGDEKFDRIFREARELHDKEEWKKAIEKFNEIVCDCPEKKYVDAAFYWLANSYRKLKMYKEARETLERLMKNFPESSWLDDARVMFLQLQGFYIAGQGNNIMRTPSIPPTPRITSTTSSVIDINGWGVTASQQTKLEREDEIRLAAFQSLLAGDQKRGIELLGEILRADSKASETLKREVIRTLRSPRSIRGQYSGNLFVYNTSPTEVDTQNRSLLRDTLLRSFQNNSNVKIRTEIIYSFVNFNDDQSVNYLMQMYSSQSDKEIKKAVINAFGGAGNSFYLTYGQFTPLATTLNKIQAEKEAVEKANLDATRATLETPRAEIAQTQAASPKNSSKEVEFRKIYFDKLMEIVRTEKDDELRRLAFSNLQRFVGWSTRDGIFDIFSQMYDADNNEQFKVSIIHALSNMKNDQATKKLLNIAKDDKSDKLRLEAIWALRGNKNPEVIKFLEDLIK
jgi:HEAT repeat protein